MLKIALISLGCVVLVVSVIIAILYFDDEEDVDL
jgi:hypothetical protein